MFIEVTCGLTQRLVSIASIAYIETLLLTDDEAQCAEGDPKMCSYARRPSIVLTNGSRLRVDQSYLDLMGQIEQMVGRVAPELAVAKEFFGEYKHPL